MAFWGHAKNFQSGRPTGLPERIKRAYSTRADHWFAYTRRSRAVLQQLGFPADRITTVQNAIDTARLVRLYDGVTADEVASLRTELGISGRDIAAQGLAAVQKVGQLPLPGGEAELAGGLLHWRAPVGDQWPPVQALG